MFYLLFIVYFIALSFAVTRSGFLKRSGLDNKTLLALFVLKILAGMALGYISLLPGERETDYGTLNYFGWQEYQVMVERPSQFFTDIFRSNYGEHYGGFFESTRSYWNDLRNNIILKFLAVFNIFSRGNYYINSLFLNFACFFGHVALYRVFIHSFPSRKLAVIAGCFLVPSTLYFSSGIHKDNIVFLALGLFSYALYFSLVNRFTVKRGIVILASFLVLLLIRNYVAVLLLPAAVALLLVTRYGWKNRYAWPTVYGLGLAALITLAFVLPSRNPLHVITAKQQDFLSLDRANTQFDMPALEPNLTSFISFTPTAVNHAFLRPYPWEYPGTLLMVPALELYGFFLLLLIAIFFMVKYPWKNKGFALFGIFFFLNLLLVIGFIVPNAGSIARYRGLYYPWVITPLLCYVQARIQSYYNL